MKSVDCRQFSAASRRKAKFELEIVFNAWLPDKLEVSDFT